MSYGNYPDLSSVQRVLVVKLRHLGDVLLTTPLFTGLHRALPNAKIDAYVYSESAPLLEGHPAIHAILSYDRKWKKLPFGQRLYREIALLSKIRRNRYDLVIQLTEGDRGAWAARFSKARYRIGMDDRRIYTHKVKSCPTPRHTVERHLDVMRRIGMSPLESEKKLVLTIPDSSRMTIATWPIPKEFILIHPTSRWRFKCYPVAEMTLLAQELIEQGKFLVFTSGPDCEEKAMVDAIARHLPGEMCLNLAGKTTLMDLAALIERASILVTVDSVAFHMSSALQTPTVALFGPTSEITWGPWKNPYARVITASMSCRPCYLDGCGGSKMCQCLMAILPSQVISELKIVAEISAARQRVTDELVDAARQ